MMDVCLMSVPHTGTTFTEELLCDHGWCTGPLNEGTNGRTVMRGHFNNESHTIQARPLAKRMPLIISLRHPYLVEESWKRRGKEIGPMVEAFGRMMGFMEYSPVIMAVDSANRDGCLRQLSDVVGVELKTDWTPKRSISDTSEMSWRDCNPSQSVVRAAYQMRGLLVRYYGAGSVFDHGISQ